VPIFDEYKYPPFGYHEFEQSEIQSRRLLILYSAKTTSILTKTQSSHRSHHPHRSHKTNPPSYPTYRSSSPTVSNTGTSRPPFRTSLHVRASRCGSMDAYSRISGMENTSLVPASINILPSFITMVLLVYSATTPISWLIRIIVFPASFKIVIRARNLFRCPRSCPVMVSSSTIIPGSMDNMEATASPCLWPRLSECGCRSRYSESSIISRARTFVRGMPVIPMALLLMLPKDDRI